MWLQWVKIGCDGVCAICWAARWRNWVEVDGEDWARRCFKWDLNFIGWNWWWCFEDIVGDNVGEGDFVGGEGFGVEGDFEHTCFMYDFRNWASLDGLITSMS